MTSTDQPKGCLWCHHALADHHGAPEATKDAYRAKGFDVEWTATACSLPECPGCREFEGGTSRDLSRPGIYAKRLPR